MDIKPRPQRKSIRLKGYDYSCAGLYFITICCHNRACLFGHISTANPVGADLCVRPDNNTTNVRPDENTTNFRPDDNTTNVRTDENIDNHLNNDFNVHPHDHSDNNTKFDTRRMQLMDTQTQSMDAQIQSIDGQTQSNNGGRTQSNNGGRTHRFAPTGISDELGLVTTPEMILNDAGRMVEKWYYELENKFPDIKCHEMVVMPNHVHFIIENIGLIAPVGADQCVRPEIPSIVQWLKTMTTNEYIRGVKMSR